MSNYNNMEAWSVSESDFPHNGTQSEKLAFCVRYAILAPSIYNRQPWQYEINGAKASLYVDRRLGLPILDPDDREAMIGCSASLHNLRLAIRYFGYKETTEFRPDQSKEDLVAIVTIGDKTDTPATEEDISLFKAITKRCFAQDTFEDKDPPIEMIKALQDAATAEGAWLHICDETTRRNILKMAVEADHIQNTSKNFRRELAAWTDPRRAESGDGLPHYAEKQFSSVMNRLTPNIVRRFRGNDGEPINDADFLESKGTPMLVVLGSKKGGAVERIRTGQALMRVLLKAEALGLSCSTLNQVCEVPEIRLRLHDDIDQQGRAHVVLRFGFGGKRKRAPRRPLSSTLTITGKPYQRETEILDKKSRKGFLSRFLGR